MAIDPTGGLNALVTKEAENMYGLPQAALQQKAKVAKTTMDAIVARKALELKERARAEIASAERADPATVAEQVNKQLNDSIAADMGGTIGELTGRTADTLNQKARSQKQGMNKLMKRAGKPATGIAGLQGRPPMRNPQAQGLAGARMAQAAAQPGGPRRMAQGGIVGFASGKKVTLSEDQKNNARKLYGDRYDRIVGPLLQMDDDDPYALNILKQIGPAVQSSYFGRNIKGADSGIDVLAGEVAEKFGAFSGFMGGFKNQSNEQRDYAKEVMSLLNPPSTPGGGYTSNAPQELLQNLLSADFIPGMSTSALSALPVLPDTTETVAETGVDTGANTGDGSGDLSSNVVLPNTSVNPLDELNLSAGDFSYKPTDATLPSNAGITEAQENLKKAGETTADSSLLTVADAPFEELSAIAPPYNQAQQQRYGALMDVYADDAVTNVDKVTEEALKAADEHLNRAQNDADYRKMKEAEEALQLRLFSPAQLASEARIATFAGGARGRGGMSNAYLNVMDRQRKDLSSGLKTLRGIDKDRISTDLDTAKTSSLRGAEARQIAENRRISGLGGIQADLNAAEVRSLADQQQKNIKNIAVYEHKSSVAQRTFAARESVIQRNFSYLSDVLRGQETLYQAGVEINMANALENNKAQKEEFDKLLEIAKLRAEYAYKMGDSALKSIPEITAAIESFEAKKTELITERLAADTGYQQLAQEFGTLSESETPAEYAEAKRKLEERYNSHVREMLKFAPLIFGELEFYRALRADLIAASPLPGELPNTTPVQSLDEDSGGPSFRR